VYDHEEPQSEEKAVQRREKMHHGIHPNEFLAPQNVSLHKPEIQGEGLKGILCPTMNMSSAPRMEQIIAMITIHRIPKSSFSIVIFSCQR
jgi:hypothetical protein